MTMESVSAILDTQNRMGNVFLMQNKSHVALECMKITINVMNAMRLAYSALMGTMIHVLVVYLKNIINL